MLGEVPRNHAHVQFITEKSGVPLKGRLSITTEPEFFVPTLDTRAEKRLKDVFAHDGELATLQEIMMVSPDMYGFSYVDIAQSTVTMPDGSEIDMKSSPMNVRRVFIAERVQVISLEDAERIAEDVTRQAGGFRGQLAIDEAKSEGIGQIVYIHRGHTPDDPYGFMFPFRPQSDRVVSVAQAK